MDTEAIEQHVVKCSCLTKTPEVKYHQPWCSYRQVATLKERIEALEAALRSIAESGCEGFVADEEVCLTAQDYPEDEWCWPCKAERALLPGRGE